MSIDITKFICSSAELVRKIQRLQFRRIFIQWFISGGCPEDDQDRMRHVKVMINCV